LFNTRSIQAEDIEKLCKGLQKWVEDLLDGKDPDTTAQDNTASYAADYDDLLHECMIDVLDHSQDLSNSDKALAMRLLYNASRNTKVISAKIYRDIVKML